MPSYLSTRHAVVAVVIASEHTDKKKRVFTKKYWRVGRVSSHHSNTGLSIVFSSTHPAWLLSACWLHLQQWMLVSNQPPRYLLHREVKTKGTLCIKMRTEERVLGTESDARDTQCSFVVIKCVKLTKCVKQTTVVQHRAQHLRVIHTHTHLISVNSS